MQIKHLLITGAVALALSACSPSSVVDFYSPAGDSLDDGDFGNSTRNNLLVQTGQANAAINLTRKFASDVPSTVNFAFNSAVLDQEARIALDQQAAWINEYSLATFRVYGHTDAVGSDGYNKSLGLRRAQAAVNYLVSRGVSRDRLEALVSFGETQPLIVTEGRERRNRRTVTEVSGFIKGREQYLDGKYAQAIYDGYIQSAAEPHEEVEAGGGDVTIDAGG